MKFIEKPKESDSEDEAKKMWKKKCHGWKPFKHFFKPFMRGEHPEFNHEMPPPPPF